MKDFSKIMWIIVDKKGNANATTLSYHKSSCIKSFMEGSQMTWSQTKKYGWKCVKVDVQITPSSWIDGE